MRVKKIALFVALPVAMSLLTVAGIATAEEADELSAPPPPADAAGTEASIAPPAGAEAAADTGSEPVDEGTGTGEASAEGAADASGAPEEEPAKEPAPVTGAFGIPLGERFDPCMVKEVLAEEELSYRKAKDVEAMGKRYRVEPRVPNAHFNQYRVSVNEHGIIYAVEGLHEPAERASACEVTKRLAGLIEEKYGKPRGRDPFGSWYVFRDMSSDTYRGIRLYAPKCRNGRFSIVYSDDAAKLAETPPEPDAATLDSAGL